MRRILSRLLLVALVLGTGVTASVTPAVAGGGEPERIVSLSPTATEMLFAIGAGDQVVAVDDQSTFPADAPITDLSGFEPNVEAIAGFDPDLVVASDDTVEEALEALDIDVLVLPAATKLRETYAQLRRLGRVTGYVKEANAVAASIKSDIAAIVDEVPTDRDRPTAYYELDDTFFSADSSTFIGRLLKLAGLKNIADEADDGGSGYPQLSSEFVVDADPDVVLLADTKCCGQSAETLAARPGFAGVAAIVNSNVVPLDDDIASRWGPRIVDLLRQIVEATKEL
jgi:iron complex transport system substrate-binding protein